jgi:acetyl esterase/lipase/lysophospholipase L1-like esterase
MKPALALIICVLVFVFANAQQKVINLYDGPAPGSESWDWSEAVSDSNMAKTKIVYNVVKPTLTVFPAEGTPNGTAVVICPGGGFHILSINSEGIDVAKWLVRRGVTCFVLKYRLAHSLTKDPVMELAGLMTVNLKKFNDDNAIAIPLGIADAKAALAYVRAHAADFGINPKRIGIIGFSAGGTLAEAAAFDSAAESRPDFAAPIYAYVPPTQNTDVPKDAPPMFLAAASDDPLHLVPSSLLLYNKWLAANKPVELHLFVKGGHGFGMNKQNIPTDNWIDRFGDWMQQEGFITPQKPLPMDWPNLNAYAADNERLKTSFSPNEKRVVFMGNSITIGWRFIDSAFFARRPYINRGISGQTTPQMLLRFRPDVIDLKPAVVVILAGTNDIAGNTGPETLETIMGNIASMAELAKAHKIKVVLSSILPAFDYPWRPGLHPAEKIVTLNSMIKEYAAKNGCVYLDYFSAMADERKGLPASLSPDGVHPNLAGYKIMEPLVEKAIKEALK